jgi:hypothetical protein
MGLGHLAADPIDPLFPFNYAQFHRRCLGHWRDREAVKRLLEDLRAAGKWRGAGIDWLIKHLEGKPTEDEGASR